MQHKILFCQIAGGWWEVGLVFLWKFSLNVIQICVCVKAQWERPSVRTSRSCYVYLKPVFFFCLLLYNFILFQYAWENMYTIWQRLVAKTWLICLSKSGRVPLGAAHQPRPGQIPQSQTEWGILGTAGLAHLLTLHNQEQQDPWLGTGHWTTCPWTTSW